jgi:hypothetical protein
MKFSKQIDPKFHIQADDSAIGEGRCGITIVKTSNGEPIPDDEPLMLFRARDRNVLAMLHKYRELCEADGCNEFQMDGVNNRIEAFNNFAKDHPERMKQPGITRGL